MHFFSTSEKPFILIHQNFIRNFTRYRYIITFYLKYLAFYRFV
jgi:hypothetical protein